MTVKRIVANLEASDPQASSDFYAKLFGLDIVMDQGWIITLASERTTTPQISIASSGGSGTPVPHVSIEVDNLDEVYQKACQADCEIVYELYAMNPGAYGDFLFATPAANCSMFLPISPRSFLLSNSQPNWPWTRSYAKRAATDRIKIRSHHRSVFARHRLAHR